MAILEGIKRQLRSVIEWNDPGTETLFFQWGDNGDEIKNASQLIVNPGQGCIFVYEGRIRSVLTEPCLIELQTANIPFWTTIRKVMQSFVSEHKVGIYFFRTTAILNQKWGTLAPIKYEDPKYGIPVTVKAFGNFSYRITEPRSFFTGIVGGHSNFTTEQFRTIMAERLVQSITDHIAELRLPYTEIDAKREEVARAITERLSDDFVQLGFAITDFRIEGTTFDDDTIRRIGRIADMTAEARALKEVGIDFAEMQRLEALKTAAGNEGGGAGLGLGLGAGIGMGQGLGQSLSSSMAPPQTPAGAGSDDPAERLARLKRLLAEELISSEEYEEKRRKILDAL